MSEFLRKALVFSFLIGLSFFGINAFLSVYNGEPLHYKKQYESATDKKTNYNGIILGSSHATHGIRPTFINNKKHRFYNFAFNGANPEFVYNWYNHFIKPKKIKPGYCIYALDFFMFDKSILSRSFEQDAEYFSHDLFMNLLSDNRFNAKTLIHNRYPFLKHRTKFAHSLRFEKGIGFFDINNYDSGYISYTNPFADDQWFVPNIEYSIESTQLEYFEKTIKQFKSDGVMLIFVFVPEYGITADTYREMIALKAIDSLANKHNIPIFNYNTQLRSELNENRALFTDWGHLNHYGSELFSKKLKHDITRIFND